MRAAARGQYYEDEIICGWPYSSWIALSEETFALSSQSYTFNQWPNGEPLIEQEQCVVDILKRVLVERIRDLNDGTKRN